MKLLTTHELHYLKYKDAYFDPKNLTGNNHFFELLDVFDDLVLVARCKEIAKDPQCQRVDNDRIGFLPVNDFRGYDLFGRQVALLQCRKIVGLADRYWLRSPGSIASMVGYWLRRANVPYFSHLVGNPGEVAEYTTEHVSKPISKLIRKIIEFQFNSYMKGCYGNLSVTERWLQEIYPSAEPSNDMGASDVNLSYDIFKEHQRDFNPKVLNIVNIAALLPYKGHQFLFEALHYIRNQREWCLHLIGEGPILEKLKYLAKDLKIIDNVVFHGHLGWANGIIDILDNAHLFVLSSLTEGMPRVLLEAMARSLPVISTDVGGVNEVVSNEYLVPIKDSNCLAKKISDYWNSPLKLEKMSIENFEKIQDFRFDRLSLLRKKWLTWMRDYGDRPSERTWEQYIQIGG
ncbi:GDP-mannose-dependent alpha-(1-6)-phosphatidylinositol monomannoside mannosyltransferase [Limihaloglobus sulfuriphilus]|uniref:GDP-mannose-dependent alpha-(1-6)-phosphatidylinositol monomannoside mannosyltransferase n=1 Tax=Limihaloglobus sulfuriphilus TaxID=1851148 RepID=A0A1Q2MFT1_9BACT|nr:glycosyltransferase [Limihaloglobus sulfuriphilus]AQQ71504.1 GDP-mannose-dependent alpha-(1-6)-phosphatidylinositol monomannoside mannosyltransferase [Limihaloglobus sulfuriphilus]